MRAGADADHIVDINKMVGDRMIALRAGFTSLRDDGDEIAEVGVFKHAGKFARRPRLVAVRVDAFDAFKSVAAGGNWQWVAHEFGYSAIAVQREEVRNVFDI